MKNILLGISLVTSSISISQSVSPEVTASAGAHFAIPSVQMSWTLGEPITSTLSNSSAVLTQGFQQGNIEVVGISDFDFTYEVNVYPNPTIDVVKVELSENVQNGIVHIIDPTGKTIYTGDINGSEFLLDFAPYSPGTYFLNLSNEKKELLHTVRLQKIN